MDYTNLLDKILSILRDINGWKAEGYTTWFVVGLLAALVIVALIIFGKDLIKGIKIIALCAATVLVMASFFVWFASGPLSYVVEQSINAQPYIEDAQETLQKAEHTYNQIDEKVIQPVDENIVKPLQNAWNYVFG